MAECDAGLPERYITSLENKPRVRVPDDYWADVCCTRMLSRSAATLPPVHTNFYVRPFDVCQQALEPLGLVGFEAAVLLTPATTGLFRDIDLLAGLGTVFC